MLPFLVDDLELEKDFISPPIEIEHVRVDRLKDGQRVSVMEQKIKDPNSLAKYDARDFQLQEIIESGSYDLLQPVSPIKLSQLDSLGIAEKQSADLEAYIDRLTAVSSVEDQPISSK